LKGSKLGNHWKYRIGNYLIITEIKDIEILIVIIKIGHIKEVYK